MNTDSDDWTAGTCGNLPTRQSEYIGLEVLIRENPCYPWQEGHDPYVSVNLKPAGGGFLVLLGFQNAVDFIQQQLWADRFLNIGLGVGLIGGFDQLFVGHAGKEHHGHGAVL